MDHMHILVLNPHQWSFIKQRLKYRCLLNTNAPLPQHIKVGLTFDTDLWPTDLNINRGHLLIKDYLLSKFEASGAKHSWVNSCTRWSRLAWALTMTFDLNINRGHLLINDYLPSLKLLGQSVLELSVAQGEVDWHDLWPWPLTYWTEYP